MFDFFYESSERIGKKFRLFVLNDKEAELQEPRLAGSPITNAFVVGDVGLGKDRVFRANAKFGAIGAAIFLGYGSAGAVAETFDQSAAKIHFVS